MKYIGLYKSINTVVMMNTFKYKTVCAFWHVIFMIAYVIKYEIMSYSSITLPSLLISFAKDVISWYKLYFESGMKS